MSSRMRVDQPLPSVPASGSAPVPFVDLLGQYAQVKDEVEEAVLACLELGNYVGGYVVQAFEEDFAAYCGVDYAVGVGNGTDALNIALQAFGAGPGKEVITVAHTFVGTAEGIVQAGATPRFVDVDPHTGTMDPALIEACINENTAAILPVHLYGRPADMDAINEIAKRYDIPVIEDAAQAQGASYKGRPVGSLGDAACFSFYPSKNLGAAGDAGAIVTNSQDAADRMRLLANHGSRFKYIHDVVGYNSRLDAIQAAILRVKLRHLDRWNDSRRELARQYQLALAGVAGVRLPAADDDAYQGVHHLFAVRLDNRDAMGLELRHRGVVTAVHYPIGVHRQAAFNAYEAPSLPHTEHWADNELSLPMFETMTGEQIEQVCVTLSETLR